MKKRIFFFFLFSIPVFSLPAQSDSVDIVREYQQAEKSLVLLKNKAATIPLQDLHQQKIAYIEVGTSKIGTFYETLGKYMPVDKIELPDIRDEAAFSSWLKQHNERYSLFILGIKDFSTPSVLPYYMRHEKQLNTLIENSKVIAFVSGQGKIFDKLPAINIADALVYTAEFEGLATSLAAQLIFGGMGAKGKLEKTLGPYQNGSGLTTGGGLRLRYSTPELVGIDSDLLRDSIAAIIRQGLDSNAYPGAQVLVAKDGHVVYHETFGYQTYDSLTPVKPTDIYDFASLTKVTTSLPALMKLYGEGKFNLDAPLKQYFPEFKNSNKADLTFRSMLAHNARLRPWIPYWRGTLKKNAKYPWKKSWSNTILNDGKYRCKTFKRDSSGKYPIRITDQLWLHKDYKEKKLYKAIRKSPLNEKPGYVYSGLLFYLLPEIVSDLTKKDFESYLNEHFYHRIGAYTLSYNPTRFFPLSRIVPTEQDTFFRMQQLHGTVHDEGAAMMAGVSSNAGLFGSANDLAKLFQMYMNYGSYGGEQIIATDAVKEFTRCQYCEEDNRRGLGFDKPLIEYDVNASSVAKDASPASFGHSGYTGTFAWADPEQKIVYIFFSNRVYPTRDNPKLYRLSIRPRIHQVIYDSIKGQSSKSKERGANGN